MLNTKILKLEEDMINLINDSGVPPTVIDLILDRVKNEASFAIKQVVKQEQQLEMEKQQAQKAVEQPIAPADNNVTNINDIVDVNLNE